MGNLCHQTPISHPQCLAGLCGIHIYARLLFVKADDWTKGLGGCSSLTSNGKGHSYPKL